MAKTVLSHCIEKKLHFLIELMLSETDICCSTYRLMSKLLALSISPSTLTFFHLSHCFCKAGETQRPALCLLMNQSAAAISGIHLISLPAFTPVPSVVMERGVVVVGGGGGGCSDKDTLLNVLCTSKDTRPNENKWPAQKASPTMDLVWDVVFFFFPLQVCLLSCEFVVS